MADMKNNVKTGIDDAARAAKTGTDRVADAVGGNSGTMGQIRDTASNLADRAGDLANQARERIGEWAGNVSTEKVQRFASDAYEAVGDQAGDFGREVTHLIRKHPLPAILVGFGIGLLLGRAARSV
jgi:ElaB/YqjD/DUF883 family membrane-anchored ribosome-binding protein